MWVSNAAMVKVESQKELKVVDNPVDVFFVAVESQKELKVDTPQGKFIITDP